MSYRIDSAAMEGILESVNLTGQELENRIFTGQAYSSATESMPQLSQNASGVHSSLTAVLATLKTSGVGLLGAVAGNSGAIASALNSYEYADQSMSANAITALAGIESEPTP